MTVRDDKRTEELKLRLTERELLDLSRLAAVDDRSVAEYVVRMLRASMYGSVATRLGEPGRPRQGRRVPVRAGEGLAGPVRAGEGRAR